MTAGYGYSRGGELVDEGRLPTERASLVDLLDRLLAGGAVLQGDLTLSIAEVGLVRISLRVLIASAGEVAAPETVHRGAPYG